MEIMNFSGGEGAAIGGTVTGGTDGSVLFVHPSGILAQDNTNFTFSTSAGLTVNKVTASNLTSGRVPFASTAGLLTDSANFTYSTTAGAGLTVAGGVATTNVNVLSLTQTWNAATVFTSVFIDTTATSFSNGSAMLKVGTGNAGTQAGFYTLATSAPAGKVNYWAMNAQTGQSNLIEFTVNNSRKSYIFAQTGGTLELSGTSATGNNVLITGTSGNGMTIAGGTATTNINALNITETWNNSGVTFTAFKQNVTDTASNAASLLMDLQVGGSSKFSVDKSGYAVFSRTVTANELTISSASGNLTWSTRGYLAFSSDGVLILRNNTGTDFGRLQFGGTTSSFPAIKRSTTTIQVRLADDSADAGMKALAVGVGVAPVLTAGILTFPNSGGAPTVGNATLVAGTVTVSTTAASATSYILLSRKTAGGTLGNLTYTISAGTSFTINSDNVADTSVVTWLIIEGA